MSSRTGTVPVSALIRQGGSGVGHVGADEDGMESGKRKSKDEYRKQKDLEEQRKAGTAPAMVDVETGRDINPHIPEFIEKTPWYVPSSGPTLKHQRPHPERQKQMSTVAEWYPKGTTERVAFKYREGACENCGAMGHAKKNCFEKPRLIGAKFTQSNIAPDDYVLPNLELGYDAKRDRWNGYNPEDYSLVAAEFDKMEETRKLIRAEQIKESGEDGEEGEGGANKAMEDEDIYAEDASAPGQSVDMDSRTRITVRNLRIREDTAGYLYNLDPNGAYYDPKSRSMRENPLKNVPGKEQEAAKFEGQNFVRYTGEVADANEAQVFAWQARCKGIDVHSLAEPTRLESLKREFEKQKEQQKSSLQNELLEKYGGEEHLHAPPKELLLAQTEQYVEYNRKGKVIKGDERPMLKSKYDEDVLLNNHTAIWGSYWREGRWGFACCHQFLKNAYCIGEQGIAAERAELGPPKPATMAGAGGQPSWYQKEQQQTTKIEPKSALPSSVAVDEEQQKSDEAKTDGDEEHSKEESSADSNNSGEEGEEEEEEESMDEEQKQAYEEQLEKEKQKKLRDDKRREAKRQKRRRQKERVKEREGNNGGKKEKNKRRKRGESSSSSDGSSSSGTDDGSSSSADDKDDFIGKDKKKYSKELRKAIKKQLKQRAEGKEMAEKGERKRKYHSGLDDQSEQVPSEVDREAYNLTRIHSADPMASFFEQKLATKKSRGDDDR